MKLKLVGDGIGIARYCPTFSNAFSKFKDKVAKRCLVRDEMKMVKEIRKCIDVFYEPNDDHRGNAAARLVELTEGKYAPFIVSKLRKILETNADPHFFPTEQYFAVQTTTQTLKELAMRGVDIGETVDGLTKICKQNPFANYCQIDAAHALLLAKYNGSDVEKFAKTEDIVETLTIFMGKAGCPLDERAAAVLGDAGRMGYGIDSAIDAMISKMGRRGDVGDFSWFALALGKAAENPKNVEHISEALAGILHGDNRRARKQATYVLAGIDWGKNAPVAGKLTRSLMEMVQCGRFAKEAEANSPEYVEMAENVARIAGAMKVKMEEAA